MKHQLHGKKARKVYPLATGRRCPSNIIILLCSAFGTSLLAIILVTYFNVVGTNDYSDVGNSIPTNPIILPGKNDVDQPNTRIQESPPMEKILVVGTRIHLGNASVAPSDADLARKVSSFRSLVSTSGAIRAAIAVEPPTEKLAGYDLVDAVSRAVFRECDAFPMNPDGSSSCYIDIIPVSPWGNFIPPLNAIVSWAAQEAATLLLLVSAETTLSSQSIQTLVSNVDSNTLVAGAVLPGHDYRGESETSRGGSVRVALNGRTTPWNTAAVWNVPKLALAGFSLVAEGLHRDEIADDGSLSYYEREIKIAGGVEEVSTIALLQKILPNTADAKLLPLPDVVWDQTFDDDERKKWHEKKMSSKVSRPAKHLELLGLTDADSYVLHFPNVK